MKRLNISKRPKRPQSAARKRKRLTEAELDRLDLIAARKALAEPGPNISLEDLKKELGM